MIAVYFFNTKFWRSCALMTNKVRVNSFSFFHAKSGSEKIISDPQHCYALFQSALDNEIKIYKCRRTADTVLVLFFIFESFFLLKKPRGPRVTRWWGPRTKPRSMTLGRTTRYLSPYNYASFFCWIKRESEGCTYIVVFHYLLACSWGNAVRSIIKKTGQPQWCESRYDQMRNYLHVRIRIRNKSFLLKLRSI
jgi:hypothetical protein